MWFLHMVHNKRAGQRAQPLSWRDAWAVYGGRSGSPGGQQRAHYDLHTTLYTPPSTHHSSRQHDSTHHPPHIMTLHTSLDINTSMVGYSTGLVGGALTLWGFIQSLNVTRTQPMRCWCLRRCIESWCVGVSVCCMKLLFHLVIVSYLVSKGLAVSCQTS